MIQKQVSGPTDIVDTLIDQLKQTGIQVHDEQPQLDEYTVVPCLHLRELSEAAPERSGMNLRRNRTLQLDIYHAADSTRRARDELLTNALRELIPRAGVGKLMPNTSLVDLQVSGIQLEPDQQDLVSAFRVNSVLFTITFTI